MNQKPPTRRGPKTAEGKKRSSMNALKHGLTAKSPHAIAAAEQDSKLKFANFLSAVRETYKPDDAVGDRLAHEAAMDVWRLARAELLKKQIVDDAVSSAYGNASMGRLIKAEAAIIRRVKRTLKILQRRKDLNTRITRHVG